MFELLLGLAFDFIIVCIVLLGLTQCYVRIRSWSLVLS